MSLQNVINQNQQTIAFLDAKDYCSAIVSSSYALERLGSIPSTQVDNFLFSARSSSSSPESSTDQCMLHNNMKENNDLCEPRPFFYNHAIQLPPGVTDHNIITPVLIFNTALAHHLMALLDKEWSPKYLHRAKQLYALAHDSSQDIEQDPLFLFVLYNNAALVDLQIGDNDLWNACVGQLVSIYMVMVDEGYTSRLRHLQGFLESLLATMPTAAAA